VDPNQPTVALVCFLDNQTLINQRSGQTVMLCRDMPSASACSLSLSGPCELSDPKAAITDTECSPSVSFRRRRTVRIRANRRLPATSAEVAAWAIWFGKLISLHNYSGDEPP